MFGLVVRFDLTADGAGAFDALAAATLEQVRVSEPGTLFYGCHRVTGAPNARIFYELYSDREAFESHERQPHVVRFLREREQFFEVPPRVEFFDSFQGKGPVFNL